MASELPKVKLYWYVIAWETNRCSPNYPLAHTQQANKYHYPPTCRLEQSRSQRIVWLLEELGFPYEIEVFHRNKQTMLAPPELQKIHPLGKSPVISVTPAAGGEPIVIAESGFMTEYLCMHAPEHKQHLVPKRWKDGQENKVGGETEAWMRHQYFLHYAEGTLMPMLVMGLVIGRKYFYVFFFFFFCSLSCNSW
jgi:hypothetical protein